MPLKHTNTEGSCQEMLWNFHPWSDSMHDWTQSWASCWTNLCWEVVNSIIQWKIPLTPECGYVFDSPSNRIQWTHALAVTACYLTNLTKLLTSPLSPAETMVICPKVRLAMGNKNKQKKIFKSWLDTVKDCIFNVS